MNSKRDVHSLETVWSSGEKIPEINKEKVKLYSTNFSFMKGFVELRTGRIMNLILKLSQIKQMEQIFYH